MRTLLNVENEKADDNIVDFPVKDGKEEARRFLHGLRDNPFLAVVIGEDGKVCVYSKDLGPDEIAQIREVIENELLEGKDADGS